MPPFWDTPEVSPDFLKRANDRNLDALIFTNEDRASKTVLRKPSVRRKLKEQPDAPAAPKPSEKRKAKKPER